MIRRLGSTEVEVQKYTEVQKYRSRSTEVQGQSIARTERVNEFETVVMRNLALHGVWWVAERG